MMMKHRAYTSVFRAHLSALALSFVALTTWAQQPQLTWIAPPADRPDGRVIVYDISADGRIAAITVVVPGNPNLYYGYVLWRGKLEPVAALPDKPLTFCYAISQDGFTVAGEVGRSWQPMLWDITNYTVLNTGGTFTDLSADGSVGVGLKYPPTPYRAFRWASGQIQDLGTLQGGNDSRAWGVSADGSIVVGQSLDSSNNWRAFRWTQQTGMQNLGASVLIGTISFPYDHSEAWGISPDGNVIVGIAYNDPNEAVGFRNILQGTRRVNISLGDPPKGFTGVYPRRTNQDGSIIVGSMRKSNGSSRAMRWTQAGGLEDLNETYANLLGEGEYLTAARDITPDGRYIVGQGFKDGKWQGFILDTGVCDLPADVDGNGIVNDQDLLQVLFEFGNRCGQ